MSKLRVPVSERDHIIGAAQASLTLVEYGDFQCPACGAAYPRTQRLLTTFRDELRLVYRHFPLTQIHPFALLGAMAAESAGRQGHFWEMHDLIFEHQPLLDFEGVMQFAAQLSLDLERFRAGLSDGDLEARIRDDFLGGVRSGVNGTPGFFLNGEKLLGMPDVEAFRAYI